MTKYVRLLMVTVFVAFLNVGNAFATDVQPGVDLFETPPGDTYVQPPLPADFFGPGSDPFDGIIALRGQSLDQEGSNLGRTSTIVERLAPANLPVVPSSDTVPIEIVALNLVSIEPIIVTYNGGLNPEEWDVQANLSSFGPQAQGDMTVNREYENGGTFEAYLHVTSRLTFTRRTDGAETFMDPLPMEIMQSPPVPPLPLPAEACWSYSVPFPIIISDGSSTVDHDGNPGTPKIHIGPSSNFVAGGCGFDPSGSRPTPGIPPTDFRKVLIPFQGAFSAHGIQPTNPLDHFKVYDVDNIVTALTVTLEDQFDSRNVYLDMIDHFANPVDKNGEQIADFNAHLIWYKFTSPDPPIVRDVEVDNQFGTQWVRIGLPEYLLVPAEKIEPGSAFPVNLDHFECYRILQGDPINTFVTLEDQFGVEGVDVLEPVWFCNPASKNYEGIISEVDHLVFYDITPSTQYSGLSIDAADQFGTISMNVDSSLWLGVPSVKTSVIIVGIKDKRDDSLPPSFALHQNTPNPFNPSTSISFGLKEEGNISLKIYDVSGKLVRVLVEERREARRHEEMWDGKDEKGIPVASGVYFYRLTAGNRTLTKKMVLLK
ncbi:MAG: T9SS type A sorting domain-containing protein [Candidatus Latescibacterota bacterium]|nr:MAG: T9SS type A sorting domain-containing protein [Candidatus Latescibacterota bacterium]